jgi:tetratricopeptide (TPR) repeat protein
VSIGGTTGRHLDVLDGLTSLVDKSLVRQSVSHQRARFTMLETIREFGREQLEGAPPTTSLRSGARGGGPGEIEAGRRQHALFFRDLAQQLFDESRGRETSFIDRMMEEYENLCAALEWHRENEEPVGAFVIGRTLWWVWYHSYRTEGRERLAALLEVPGLSPTQRTLLLRYAGQLAWLQGDCAAARACLEECVALHRGLEDTSDLPAPLNALGQVVKTQGDYVTARACFEESLELLRAQDSPGSLAWVLQALGELALDQGDIRAAALIEESLTLFRALGDRHGIAFCLNNLGEVARAQCDFKTARSLHEQSLSMTRQDEKGMIARSLVHLGAVARAEGDLEAARSFYTECMAMQRELGDRRNLPRCLEGLGAVDLQAGQRYPIGSMPLLQRAARQFGTAAALREALSTPPTPADRADLQEYIEMLRVEMGETAFIAAWEQGRSMPVGGVIAEAIQQAAEAELLSERAGERIPAMSLPG